MVGVVWWGARRALPSTWPLHIQKYSPKVCRNKLSAQVRCCADVHAMQLVEKEYAELELRSIHHQVGGVRVRQHVNPFKPSLTAPIVPPAWETEFADPTLPLHVDIGCGSGRFLMVLAKRSLGTRNFLGLDVRDKLLQRSTIWAEELNLTNIPISRGKESLHFLRVSHFDMMQRFLHFIVANATLGLDAVLSKYPGPLTFVSILCPDPHFKQRHRKRRIVQKPLVDALVKYLKPGGQIFLQSDVEEVAKDMRDQFDVHTAFARVHSPDSTMCNTAGWLLESPLGIATEREIHAVANGGEIFRLLFKHL